MGSSPAPTAARIAATSAGETSGGVTRRVYPSTLKLILDDDAARRGEKTENDPGSLRARHHSTVARHPQGRRLLATVLFTDIVGSTQLAAELGDAAWRQRVARHHALIRRLLKLQHGRETDTA